MYVVSEKSGSRVPVIRMNDGGLGRLNCLAVNGSFRATAKLCSRNLTILFLIIRIIIILISIDSQSMYIKTKDIPKVETKTQSLKLLWIVLCLRSGLFLAELITGLRVHSLSLTKNIDSSVVPHSFF